MRAIASNTAFAIERSAARDTSLIGRPQREVARRRLAYRFEELFFWLRVICDNC